MMWSDRSSAQTLPAYHLADSQVVCWLAWLDCTPQVLAQYENLLSPDETTRAARFFFQRDRSQSIVSRGILRRLLGAYLNCDPDRVSFDYGPHGKPVLQAGLAKTPIEFNVTHAHGLGLFVFSSGQPLGVDVEFVRPMPDEDALAEQFFAASEINWLAARQRPEKQADFFKIWTAKEAFFKASGDGLTLPISLAEVDLKNAPQVRLASIAGDQALASGWQIISFEPAPGYQAAVAVQGKDWTVSCTWLQV